MTTRPIVYTVPGMDAVTVRRDLPYRATGDGALAFDLYAPPDAGDGAPRPAVVFVSGYPDPGFERMFGCKLKDMASYRSWGRLVAASGLVAVTYANRDPAPDLAALLDHIRADAASLGIDAGRLGVWACSGNVGAALSLLIQRPHDTFRCAALCYGYMLDLDGSTAVADAAAQFGFVTPPAGASVDDIPPALPLLVVRAGRDEMPGLNDTIDRFIAAAQARDLPLSVHRHATAPHAFDLMDDSDASREAIRRIVAFLRDHLLE